MNLKTTFLSLLFIASVVSAEGPAPDSQLRALFSEEWQFHLKEDPLFATSVGVHDFNDRLPSVTEEDQQRRAKYWRSILQRLRAIDKNKLSIAERINYDLFERDILNNISEVEFRGYLIPITVDTGFHIGFARLPRQVPLSTAKDYENYIARLRAFPEYVRQHIALMREGLRTGMTMPAVVLDGYEVTINTHVVQDPAKSVFHAPFTSFPSTIPQAQQTNLRSQGEAAIRDAIVPAYREFSKFMIEQYRPNTRKTLAASELPNGRKYYQYLIQNFTTLNLSPEEIHKTGLSEVDRIQKEMQQIIRKVKFDGDFPAFLKFLRTDPRFYAKTPEQLLKEASYIAKRMDGKLPAFFTTLPRLPYGVAPVPEHLAPKYTAGRYVGPSVGSTEPGYYWVNTYALESRPLYALEALTLHEAVPGHHLQTAIATELQNVPEFRKHMYLSAFGEGWGLYSEWLGREAGFYTDPYSDFGRLTYEMWRACRLVIDTGIHAMGWTRQQAMDFMAQRTALSLHEVKTETDRYISWPGQALAYKIGELKIRELRRKAETELGEKFDIRKFHDAVLGNGSVTLPVLEQIVNEYIKAEKPRR